jgi:hypothetical protein
MLSLSGAGADGFEAFLELEDGALEEVVRESGGGYGEAECEGDPDYFVPIEVDHSMPVTGRFEQQPKEECMKEIQAIRDLS